MAADLRPAVHLYREGEINDDIFDIVTFESRLPSRTIGGIRAEVSAVVTGVRRLQDVAARSAHRHRLSGDASDRPAR